MNEGPKEIKKDEYVPVRIKPAQGEEVVLKENDLAVLIVMDPTTGAPVVYDIQNCPLRGFARMLMNEALMLYQLTSQGHTTVALLKKDLVMGAQQQKGKLEVPGGK